MENKPRFCHSCGAALVGEAAFCASCGAKQPTTVRVATPVPAVASAPAVTPEPAPVVMPASAPAPVAAPVAPPENTLVPKAKVSTGGLILAIAAICLSLLASVLYYVLNLRNFGSAIAIDPTLYTSLLRRPDFLVGLFTGIVVPLIAMIMVLTKKKPAAIIGLALTALFIVVQLIVTASYLGLMWGRPGILKYSPISIIALTNMVNGENLFAVLRDLFHGRRGILLPTASALFFHLKNYLALAACLLAAIKKKN